MGDNRRETVSADKVQADAKVLIPKQFLNSMGFIEYDHYGRKPWTGWQEAKGDIFLPPSYIAVTDLLGIDCEMVGVGEYKDSALGRVSIVNEYGYCIYDTCVKPKEEVTDYRTEFSGIRRDDLIDAPDVDLVLKTVSDIVCSKILVGHSIHNDLDVLKLYNHPKSLIRDIAIYFKKELKTKGVPSLKELTRKFLRFNIQTGEHNSIQDAQATLKLYLIHRNKWEQAFLKRREDANLTLESRAVTLGTPDAISDMHVEPREPDLFVDSETVFLRENKIIGAYSSCEEYLDIQFRLLLEDFLRPLRDGVKNVHQFHKDKKCLFHNVQIRIGGKKSNFDVKHSGDILVPIERNNLKDVDWEESNIFLNGSLLLLTPDNFKSVKFAVIKFRYDIPDPEEQANLHFLKLCVIFSNHGPSWTVGENNNRFLMMESTAFYEAYKHSLEYLQTVDLNIFPLKKYIVDAVTTSEHSSCICTSNKLDFSVLTNPEKIPGISSHKAYPLDFENWPNAHQLNLDGSQFEAFQRALTQEMTIIQGPPGTGKTFIGIQIIKLILSNYWFLNSPILVVAYTNHALDQTLELILDFIVKDLCGGKETEAQKMILRIGGGSKSEIIQPLVLKYKLEMYREKKKLFKKLDLLRKIVNTVQELDFQDLLIRQGILDFQTLPKVILDKLSNDEKTKVIFDRWQKFQQKIKKDPYKWFGFGAKLNGSRPHRYFIISFENHSDSAKYLHFLYNMYAKNCINSVNRTIMLPEESQLEDTNRDKSQILKARLIYYFYLVAGVKDFVEEMTQRVIILEKEYLDLEHSLSKNLLIRSAKVIGMTTTGAVKYKDAIIHKVQPKMMIVEEAAHILEAHVVASLSEHCQQMIMIGDHKQLRPLTADYNLAKDYNLDISLMERLVRNGESQGNQNWTQLKIQHRMRPEIARMVCPVIYQELYNHPRVFNYPAVKGYSKNLFFVDHQNKDQKEIGSRSHFNEYEVNFISDLVQHFVYGGFYLPHQITVIAMYLAQKILIENKLKDLTGCCSVKVSTVDGYQGEENDIILLSLVRSNYENNVGFLKTDNRVCVALSRARHGLFMVGNMSCLKSESKTWQNINDILVKMDNIGTSIPITTSEVSFQSASNSNLSTRKNKVILPRCEIVKVVQASPISTSQSNKVVPTLKSHRLPCRHTKELSEKQKMDLNEVKCNILVEKKLRCGHLAKVACHEDSWKSQSLCMTPVNKFLGCGHQLILPCSQPPYSKECTTKLVRKLPCGHNGTVLCRDDINKAICKTAVQKLLPCGHQLIFPCCNPIYEHICKSKDGPKEMLEEKQIKNGDEIVSEKKRPCGHPLKGQGGRCTEIVDKILPCGHENAVMCHVDVQKMIINCKMSVEKLLSCGHQQIADCYLPLSKIKCITIVLKELPCGHKQNGHCHQSVSTMNCHVGVSYCEHQNKGPCFQASLSTCSIQVTKTLNCGLHQIEVPCCQNVSKMECTRCKMPVKKILPCGHQMYCLSKEEVSKIQCKVLTESIFNCGHLQKYECYLRDQIKCSILVMKKLSCGHEQEVKCHLSPNEIQCKMIVSVPTNCCHSVTMECFKAKNVSSLTCNRKCEKMFNCGHRCILPCHGNQQSPHSKYRCVEICKRSCPQGHSCYANHECYQHCPLKKSKDKCLCPKTNADTSPGLKSTKIGSQKYNGRSTASNNQPTLCGHQQCRRQAAAYPQMFPYTCLEKFWRFQNHSGNYLLPSPPLMSLPFPDYSVYNNNGLLPLPNYNSGR